MIKINIKEGLRLSLPPATLRDIFEVCIWAILATSIIGGIVLSAYFILEKLVHCL